MVLPWVWALGKECEALQLFFIRGSSNEEVRTLICNIKPRGLRSALLFHGHHFIFLTGLASSISSMIYEHDSFSGTQEFPRETIYLYLNSSWKIQKLFLLWLEGKTSRQETKHKHLLLKIKKFAILEYLQSPCTGNCWETCHPYLLCLFLPLITHWDFLFSLPLLYNPEPFHPPKSWEMVCILLLTLWRGEQLSLNTHHEPHLLNSMLTPLFSVCVGGFLYKEISQKDPTIYSETIYVTHSSKKES